MKRHHHGRSESRRGPLARHPEPVIGPATSAGPVGSDGLSPHAGKVSNSVLAARFCARVCLFACPSLRLPRFGPVFGTVSSPLSTKRGEAERRQAHQPSTASRMRRRPPSYPPPHAGRNKEGAARLSAFHRGFCPGDSSSQGLSIGPGFLGPGRSVRSISPLSGRSRTRFLGITPRPHLSQSSEHLARRS
jgi:hypothetical protein